MRSIDFTNLIKCKHLYRAFSVTWPASMQIYWKKRRRLRKKRVQLPQDWFGALTNGRRLIVLGHQYGRRENTLYLVKLNKLIGGLGIQPHGKYEVE